MNLLSGVQQFDSIAAPAAIAPRSPYSGAGLSAQPALRRSSRIGLIGLLAGVLAVYAALPAAAAIQDLPDEYDLSALMQSPSGRGAIQLGFARQEKGEGYVLVVGAHDLKLQRDTGRRAETLDTFNGIGLADARETPMKVTVQRRSGRIFVLAGSSLVMDVEDNTFTGGSAESANTGDGTCTDLRVQPVEPIYFSDDFMRQANERGEWRYEAGAWRIQTVGIAERGANPFSLESSPNPQAFAMAGYPFWSDYSFQAAAKGSSGTSFGICADVQDRDNYYLLRWTSGQDGALELLRVVAGKPTSIARQAGGFIPGLWYQIGLRTSGGMLIAEVDHQPRLSVHDATFGAGKIGLYSEGAGQTVWFDSILVKPAAVIVDNFSQERSHRWQTEDEKAVGGSPEWANYTVTARVDQPGDLIGIPVHFRDPRNYSALIWDTHSCSLVSIVDGEHRVLSDAKINLQEGRRYTVEVGCQDGYLWGAFDGKKTIEALEPHPAPGRAGFQPASQAGRSFRSLAIRVTQPPDPTDALTAEFTQEGHHPDMAGWAGPLHAWSRATFGTGQGYWHKGDLFGDTTAVIPLSAALLKNGKFAVILNANGKTEGSGYVLNYEATTPGGIALSLYREGQPVASGKLPAPTGDDPVGLHVYRHGSFIYAAVGGNVALRYRDPQPLDNYSLPAPLGWAGDGAGHDRLGLIIRSEPSPDIPSIEIDNPNVYAETFHLAPVNWRPQSGQWQVTSRWSCQPGWTWYGGKSDGYAVNWHKSPLWGDQSIEYYTAAMMSATADAGRESWQDFNCAFCADGVNLFSGYTLVVGGWHNTATRLYRKGRMVAEDRHFQFPPAGTAHRWWYDIHIIKQGGHIQVVASLNENPTNEQNTRLIDWTDPNPIAGGFTSFWTHDNGMVLARAVLSAQDQGSAPLYTAAPVWLASLPAAAPYPGDSEVGLAARDLVSPTAIAEAAPSAFDEDHGTGVLHPIIHLAQGPTHPASAPHHASFTDPADAGSAGAPLSADNETPQPRVLVNPAPGVIGFGRVRNGLRHPHAANAGANPGRANPAGAYHPAGVAETTVEQAPVQLDANGMALTVEPGGVVTDVQYQGQQVLRKIVMDIRTSEWHQVRLDAENSRVRVLRGAQPGIDVEFHVRQPDLNMVVSGHELIHILPGGVLKAEATIDPGSTFQSNRISINLIIPAEGFAGHRLFATSAGTRHTIAVPAEPLFPIQFATRIKQLWLPRTGMEIRPLGGVGVLEDLRHYNLNEFWFEQEADYTYPQIPAGARKYVGLEVSFGGAPDLTQ